MSRDESADWSGHLAAIEWSWSPCCALENVRHFPGRRFSRIDARPAQIRVSRERWVYTVSSSTQPKLSITSPRRGLVKLWLRHRKIEIWKIFKLAKRSNNYMSLREAYRCRSHGGGRIVWTPRWRKTPCMSNDAIFYQIAWDNMEHIKRWALKMMPNTNGITLESRWFAVASALVGL